MIEALLTFELVMLAALGWCAWYWRKQAHRYRSLYEPLKAEYDKGAAARYAERMRTYPSDPGSVRVIL